MMIYGGMFLLAFSFLAVEITLARLLSVVTWYHLAFFAISSAMLGLTGAAVAVYLARPRSSPAAWLSAAAQASLRFALCLPVTVLALCQLPLDLRYSQWGYLNLLLATLVCALPFFFAGSAITILLTRVPRPIGKMYAADLLGAAGGCLFVLALLNVMDAPSLILLCGATGALAGTLLAAAGADRPLGRRLVGLAAVLAAVAVGNVYAPWAIRPHYVKGRATDAREYLSERWNSFSRVVVHKPHPAPPQLWGPSRFAPTNLIEQYYMDIDGDAATVLRPGRVPAELEHLKYDVTTVGYHLDRPGPVCVIGVGGGRDLQSALAFGHTDVLGVDVNPVFIDLIEGRFRDFVNLAGRPGVRLLVDDARSHLARSQEQFAFIQMSLIDTWAATGAGAFSLTENALYTVEAWRILLQRLQPDGVFMVSRWHSPRNLGETGRVISLAVATLLKLGVADPSQHLALITTDRISTLLLSRAPFRTADLAALREACTRLAYEPAYLPDQPAADGLIARLAHARSAAEISAVSADSDLNYEPPTDARPYFFNMLKLSSLGKARAGQGGVVQGNFTATLTLLVLLGCLLVLAVLTVVLPLALRKRARPQAARSPGFWAGALYFALIGAAFMLVEIGLIQTLSVFLGHPTYALGVLLFTLIASTGLGSLLSDRLPVTDRGWSTAYPIAAAVLILAVHALLQRLLPAMETAPLAARVPVAMAVLFPLGLVMGGFFPTGMRLTAGALEDETPWYWALNGIMSVLCSVLAVVVSIYAGISVNFLLGAAGYAALLLVIPRLRHVRPAA